jgi:hypothetical protein
METIESLRERLEVLQNQVHAFAKQMGAAERRLRWWRILACGLLVLSLVILPFAGGTAQEQSSYERALARRLAPLSTSCSISTAALTRLSSPERTCASSMAWGIRRPRTGWVT